MKKIFYIGVLSIGMTVCGQAQIKKAATSPTNSNVVKTDKLTAEMQAQKNVADLNSFIKLTAEESENFLGLFKTKIKMMDNAGQSVEQKNEVSRIIGRKLEASLDNQTFEKLKANSALFKSLIN